MAPEKRGPEKLAARRTVEDDPSFMLLWYYIKNTKDGTTDWQAIAEKMRLPSVAAT